MRLAMNQIPVVIALIPVFAPAAKADPVSAASTDGLDPIKDAKILAIPVACKVRFILLFPVT